MAKKKAKVAGWATSIGVVIAGATTGAVKIIQALNGEEDEIRELRQSIQKTHDGLAHLSALFNAFPKDIQASFIAIYKDVAHLKAKVLIVDQTKAGIDALHKLTQSLTVELANLKTSVNALHLNDRYRVEDIKRLQAEIKQLEDVVRGLTHA